MNEAKGLDTTPVRGVHRRGLLTATAALMAGAAAVTAGRGAPAPATGVDGADAELIRLCDRLVTLNATYRAILSTQQTIEDETRTDPPLDAVGAEESAILDRLYSLAPVTLAGATAMARAAVALTLPRVDNLDWPPNPEEWLAMGVAEFLAGQQDRSLSEDCCSRPQPDAELLAQCSAFHRQHAAAQAVEGDDGLTAALDERWNISDRTKAIPATTEAGRRAKASVAAVLLRENDDFSSASDAFAYSTLLDIAGSAVA